MSSAGPIGFSTGALAGGDVRRALAALGQVPAGAALRAVELSALREAELGPLLAALPELEAAGALAPFAHVSLHAPSAMARSREAEHAAALVRLLVPRGMPCIVHPDALRAPATWAGLGALLLVESMDGRKPTGRTADELARTFDALPEARLCFDVAHAWHVDETMAEGRRILAAFGDRLAQVHLSGIDRRARHRRLDPAMLDALARVADRIPPSVPVILESPIPPGEDRDRGRAIEEEMERARSALGR